MLMPSTSSLKKSKSPFDDLRGFIKIELKISIFDNSRKTSKVFEISKGFPNNLEFLMRRSTQV